MNNPAPVPADEGLRECEGDCYDEHDGEVIRVSVTDPRAGHSWGEYWYCQKAISVDRHNGLRVEAVSKAEGNGNGSATARQGDEGMSAEHRSDKRTVQWAVGELESAMNSRWAVLYEHERWMEVILGELDDREDDVTRLTAREALLVNIVHNIRCSCIYSGGVGDCDGWTRLEAKCMRCAVLEIEDYLEAKLPPEAQAHE